MKTLFLMALLSVSLFAQAEEATLSTQQQAPAAVPKLKASLTTYYYDFEGAKGAKNSSYSFKDLTLGMQLATLTYEVSPTLNLMVMGTHLDNYAETYMFGKLYKDRVTGTGDTLVSLMKTFVPS